MFIPKNIQQVKDGVYKRISYFVKKRAKKQLMANEKLWQTISEYRKKSGSTGADYSDYLALYNYIRSKKPIEVLECGTGVTTIVMAFAMKENENESGVKGRITSMEDVEKWYLHAKKLLPEEFESYVDICLSPAVVENYAMFRGTRYESVPDRQYSFVFTDGPTYTIDGELLCNFDYLYIVRNSDIPVAGFIDKRLSTCLVYWHVFGKDKIKFDYFRGLGICLPCSKKDVLPTNIMGRSFVLRNRIPRIGSAMKFGSE